MTIRLLILWEVMFKDRMLKQWRSVYQHEDLTCGLCHWLTPSLLSHPPSTADLVWYCTYRHLNSLESQSPQSHWPTYLQKEKKKTNKKQYLVSIHWCLGIHNRVVSTCRHICHKRTVACVDVMGGELTFPSILLHCYIIYSFPSLFILSVQHLWHCQIFARCRMKIIKISPWF